MYEENRTGFILKDILLQIILVVVFVFLLLWLFPTKGYVDNKIDNSLSPLYQEMFNEHLQAMKDAAQNYYTTARLPKKVGDKVSITLGEMLDKKLVVSFVDSNNKQCSLTGSYVEITKMDKEYMMKVNLSCSDKSDYIISYMGCYNYCDSALCEKQEETKKPTSDNASQTSNKKYKYEYELVTGNGYSDWSNWSKWSTTKVTGNDYRQVDTKKEWEVVDTERVLVSTNTYYEDAKRKTTTKTYAVKTSVECPDGYTKYSNDENSKLCVAKPLTTNASTGTTTSYIDAIATTVKVCPDGRITTNDWCFAYNDDIKPATPSTTYGEWVYSGRQTFIGTMTSTDTKKYTYVSSKDDLDCTDSCKKVTKNTYDVYTRTADTTYSCTGYSGYTLSGNKCVKNIVTSVYGTWTVQTQYSCSNGATPVNGKCPVATTQSSTQKCTGKGSYDQSTGLCYVRGTTVTNCDGKISGNKCTVEVLGDYTCEKGTLIGSQCKITENKYENKKVYGYVTYYRYRTRDYIDGTRKTAWSSSKNDKDLLNKGYKLTGVKKEVTTA